MQILSSIRSRITLMPVLKMHILCSFKCHIHIFQIMCNAWKYANTEQLVSWQATSKNKPKDDCSALHLLKLNF